MPRFGTAIQPHRRGPSGPVKIGCAFRPSNGHALTQTCGPGPLTPHLRSRPLVTWSVPRSLGESGTTAPGGQRSGGREEEARGAGRGAREIPDAKPR